MHRPDGGAETWPFLPNSAYRICHKSSFSLQTSWPQTMPLLGFFPTLNPAICTRGVTDNCRDEMLLLFTYWLCSDVSNKAHVPPLGFLKFFCLITLSGLLVYLKNIFSDYLYFAVAVFSSFPFFFFQTFLKMISLRTRNSCFWKRFLEVCKGLPAGRLLVSIFPAVQQTPKWAH